VLKVVVVIVSGDGDKFIGDQIFGSGARLLPRGLVVNAWVGLTKSVDKFAESPKDLNFWSALSFRTVAGWKRRDGRSINPLLPALTSSTSPSGASSRMKRSRAPTDLSNETSPSPFFKAAHSATASDLWRQPSAT
jgi:hypothetical protein